MKKENTSVNSQSLDKKEYNAMFYDLQDSDWRLWQYIENRRLEFRREWFAYTAEDYE